MSAFMCNPTHINAIVDYIYHNKLAVRGELLLPAGMSWEAVDSYQRATRLGQLMVDANVASMITRYPQDDIKEHWYKFNFKPNTGKPVSFVQFAKAVACFDYQSCETDEWRGSALQVSLNSAVISGIVNQPGYEDAHWEIPEIREEDANTQGTGFTYSLKLYGLFPKKRKEVANFYEMQDSRTLDTWEKIDKVVQATIKQSGLKVGGTWSVTAYPAIFQKDGNPIQTITAGTVIKSGKHEG